MKKKLLGPKFLIPKNDRYYLRKSELGSYILGEHSSSQPYCFVGQQSDNYNDDINFEDEENSKEKKD